MGVESKLGNMGVVSIGARPSPSRAAASLPCPGTRRTSSEKSVVKLPRVARRSAASASARRWSSIAPVTVRRRTGNAQRGASRRTRISSFVKLSGIATGNVTSAGIGASPGGVTDLLPQIPRLHRLVNLARRTLDRLPVAVVLDGLEELLAVTDSPGRISRQHDSLLIFCADLAKLRLEAAKPGVIAMHGLDRPRQLEVQSGLLGGDHFLDLVKSRYDSRLREAHLKRAHHQADHGQQNRRDKECGYFR